MGDSKTERKSIVSPELYQQTMRQLLQPTARKAGVRDFVVLASQELADGVTAVLDTWQEIDIVFDAEKWEPIHPEIWKSKILHTVTPFSDCLGILPGISTFPAVRDFTAATMFAKSQLKPKVNSWYDKIPAVNHEAWVAPQSSRS